MEAVSERHAKVALALKAARCQGIDQVTAQVVETLRREGIRAIVLKGPVFALWLYRDGAIRTYDDSDLLVAPRDVPAASRVLRSLGFEPYAEPSGAYSEAMGAKHASCWARDWPGGALVDLHDSVAGAGADKEAVWAALSRDTGSIRLGHVDVETTGPAANALIVALHAANNGPDHEGSREDLSRALEIADVEAWSAAARLAREVGAEDFFAAGLRMLAPGRKLADRLDLARPTSIDVLLRADGVADGALFLGQLAATGSWPARARLLGRALVPDASYMRNNFPIANRGRLGLPASYAVRAGRRIATAVPALVALAGARREARAGRRGPG